jgi:methyl-accepting chemotaxis protein
VAVRGLGELIEEIGLMVDVITSIADQTNLLSLNAAIEAARAGEQGRAFAVVAEEVKKLAGESRESAGKIVNMVKRIESERVKTIASMDLNLKEVSEGREVITKALNALEEIAQMVHETADMSQNISALSREQEEAIQRITQVVDEISTVAGENAASTEEISASTEEQTAGMESLTATAQELSGMAQNLHAEVDKFRVESRGSKTAGLK